VVIVVFGQINTLMMDCIGFLVASSTSLY